MLIIFLYSNQVAFSHNICILLYFQETFQQREYGLVAERLSSMYEATGSALSTMNNRWTCIYVHMYVYIHIQYTHMHIFFSILNFLYSQWEEED